MKMKFILLLSFTITSFVTASEQPPKFIVKTSVANSSDLYFAALFSISNVGPVGKKFTTDFAAAIKAGQNTDSFKLKVKAVISLLLKPEKPTLDQVIALL